MIDPISIIKTIGTGGGATATALLASMFMFTTADDFSRHVAESRTSTVLNLMEKLGGDHSPEIHSILCRALLEEISALCLDTDGESVFCVDRAMIQESVGCG